MTTQTHSMDGSQATQQGDSMDAGQPPMMASQMLSHSMPSNSPSNPMNWPMHRKLYTTACGWLFGFGAAFGLTSISTGFMPIAMEFNVSTTVSILAFTIYLFGVAFAPVYSPHVAERFGRSIFYFITYFIHSLFIIGASRSNTIGALLVCRFFAGFFAGPSLVLIEGTFADIWPAETTNTYYAFLGCASYIGSALGPLICGFVVTARDWRWSQYVVLMVDAAVMLFAAGMPETYQREIPRREARRRGEKVKQTLAESGVTIGQMLKTTVLEPLVMLVSEPVVILATLHLLWNWAALFQWFITVPTVLNMVYGWSLQMAGLAFSSAIVGSVLAAATSVGIEQFFYRQHKRSGATTPLAIELRLIPALIGSLLMPASLFWIGWTAEPTTSPYVPIVGTAVYVYGSLLCVISIVPYLFDAYPPAGTLSALTIAAVMRILLGGAIPLVILQAFTNITGAWALSALGFVGFAFAPAPFALFFFGKRLRDRSRFSQRLSIHGNAMHTAQGDSKPEA